MRGNTDRTAIFHGIGDVDGLGFLPVAEAEQELAGFIGAGLHHHRIGAADDETLRQFFLQWAGDRRHLRKIGLALVVDPVPQLLHPKRFFPDRGEFDPQLFPRHTHEIAPAVGQRRVRRIEQRRLGQDALAFRLREVDDCVHFGGHALLIAL